VLTEPIDTRIVNSEVIHFGEKRAIGSSGLAWFDLLQNQVFPVFGIIALDSLLDSDVSGKMK
jgi:hypothetical protein